MKNLFLAGFTDGNVKHESNSLNVPVEYVKTYYADVAAAFAALHVAAYKSDPNAMYQPDEQASRQASSQTAQEAGRLAATEQPATEAALASADATMNVDSIRRKVNELNETTDDHELAA